MLDKTPSPKKKNYPNVWKKKIAQWEKPASLEMFYTTLE